MQKLNFSIAIHASVEKVWWTLWNDASYRRWASVFHEGSYAVSDWKTGSAVHFLAPDGAGMFSIVEESIPCEVMVFKHIGFLKDFQEQPETDETRQWSGARERYRLVFQDGITHLHADFDCVDEQIDYFNDAFPKALQIVKDLSENFAIIVTARVKAPIDKVWNCWTSPGHITQWCQASDDWHAPYAESNLLAGGSFKTTMAAKDGSFSFDFEGVFTRVEPPYALEYTIADSRMVKIAFSAENGETDVVETFEPESTHSWEMQQTGWQAILDSFKRYTEAVS